MRAKMGESKDKRPNFLLEMPILLSKMNAFLFLQVFTLWSLQLESLLSGNEKKQGKFTACYKRF